MEKKAWVVAADMGYGHQRAAYPLKDIAYERIINANSDKIISKKELKIWRRSQRFYEWVSRSTRLPIIGNIIFKFFNIIQRIDPYYPKQENSKPSYAVVYLERKIKKGVGKFLIDYVSKEKLPFVTTFYIPAIAANYYKLPKTYCVITDSDINRIWVPKNPKNNIINYLAPCQHAVNRLISYGVKEENIFLTGFPLPKECIGKNSEIAKKALSNRLINLDPKKNFINPHIDSINSILNVFDKGKKPEKITLAFVVGGAGAQKEIGIKIMKSLKNKIMNDKIRLVLVAGTRMDIKQYFEDEAKKIGFEKGKSKNLIILGEMSKKDYFYKFNMLLNETDILWTKPSELSFYCALGIPIIMAPTIGAQEIWNRKWLLEIGSGIDQEDPNYVSEWLDEWIEDGRLARKAFEGFLNAERMGTYKIEDVLFGK